MTKTDEMEIVYAGYAGGLMGAHIGEDVRIDKIHKYKYRGEQREKIKVFRNVFYIRHEQDTVNIYAQIDSNSYREWVRLKPLDEIVVRVAK